MSLNEISSYLYMAISSPWSETKAPKEVKIRGVHWPTNKLYEGKREKFKASTINMSLTYLMVTKRHTPHS